MKRPNEHDPAQATSTESTPPGLALEVIPGRLAICRLTVEDTVPPWAEQGRFSFVSRTPDELSIVCDQRHVPEQQKAQRGWRAIKVAGTLDFSLIGVLASIAQPLADAGLGLFCISTYDTDYILVRAKRLASAVRVLKAAGHQFDVPPEQLAASIQDTPAETEPVPQPSATTAIESPAASEHRIDDVPEDSPEDGEPAVEASATDQAPENEPDLAAQPATATEEVGSSDPEADPDASTPQRSRRRRGGARRRRRRPANEDTTATPAEALEPVDARSDEPDAPDAPLAEADTADAVAVHDTAPSEHDTVPADASATFDGPATREPATEEPASEEPAVEPPAPTPFSAERAPRDDEAEAEGLYTGAIPQHPVETTDQTFDGLGLGDELLRTVAHVGFAHPTPIQAAVIPLALEGRDLIGLAETGSGKTAAFVLPLAERLTHGRGIRGLILCPTREIALQTKAFLDLLGEHHNLVTTCVIGGVKIGPQMQDLRKKPDIVVATPGRLVDHLGRGTVRLDEIQALVLDEADHMLDLGFLPQIQNILQELPDERHTMMFSATMPPPIERLAQRFMDEPEQVDFRPKGRMAKGIEHRLYLVEETNRIPCLHALLDEQAGSTLIFTRRKIEAESLVRQLQTTGTRAVRLHSDRSQGQRVQALRAFREGQTRILVATDVAARGLDIPLIAHVINFGFPEEVEDYVHRAGRTARGSAKGVVSSIGTWRDKVTIREIERAIGMSLPRANARGVEPYVELKRRKVIRRRLL